MQWWKARTLAHDEAPFLGGIGLHGAPIDLRSYRGQTVLVHFWGTWCPICRLTDGAVDAIAEDRPVIGVAMQSGDYGELRAFMAESGLDFQVISDPRSELAALWGVTGVPTSFVVDAKGQIRFATVGASSETGLRARLWLADHLE